MLKDMLDLVPPEPELPIQESRAYECSDGAVEFREYGTSDGGLVDIPVVQREDYRPARRRTFAF
jgi:hypothetical protein